MQIRAVFLPIVSLLVRTTEKDFPRLQNQTLKCSHRPPRLGIGDRGAVSVHMAKFRAHAVNQRRNFRFRDGGGGRWFRVRDRLASLGVLDLAHDAPGNGLHEVLHAVVTCRDRTHDLKTRTLSEESAMVEYRHEANGQGRNEGGTIPRALNQYGVTDSLRGTPKRANSCHKQCFFKVF